jgi:two-component system, OmpR family, sensor kinase
VTLRFRLLVAAGLLVLALTVVGYVLMRTVEVSQLGQLDRQLSTMVPIAAGLGRVDRPPAPTSALPPRSRQPSNQVQVSDTYIAVITGTSRKTIASPQTASGEIPQLPPVQRLISNAALHPSTVGSVNGPGHWRALALRGPDGGEVLLAIYMGPADTTASQLRVAIFVAGGVMAAILLAGGFWLERLGLRPIAEMTTVADAITGGDRSRRVVTTPRSGEAAHLASAFNAMLDKQDAMLDRQTEIEDGLRRFIADASHELRTPISVISGLTQLWRQGDFKEGAELDQAMRRIGQESNRMWTLAEELLLLAHLDAGSRPQLSRVELGQIVEEVMADAAVTNPSRHITAEVDPGIDARGDPQALRRVISNLVVNSLVHTPATSMISIRARRAEPTPGAAVEMPQGASCGGTFDAVVEVSDSGPGMDPTLAKHAFERFWRADPSRSSGAGAGLGLSIAKAIIDSHGGRIELESAPDIGTTVRIVLPVSRSTPAHQTAAS